MEWSDNDEFTTGEKHELINFMWPFQCGEGGVAMVEYDQHGTNGQGWINNFDIVINKYQRCAPQQMIN